MTDRRHTLFIALSTFAPIAMMSIDARADINGFGSFDPGQWKINSPDASVGPSPGSNSIQLTNRSGYEQRSIFYLTQQPISQFTASFTYRAANLDMSSPFGAAFVLQNSAAAAAAVGGTGGDCGYSGITKSVAYTLEMNSGGSASGQYFGGNVSGGSPSTLPNVDLRSGHDILVSFSYTGGIMQTTLLDTATNLSFTKSYFVDIPTQLGSSTGWIGITASTGNAGFSAGSGEQYFSNLQFTSVPTPATACVLALGSAMTLRRRRR